MKTSRKPTSANGAEKSTSSRGDSPASLSAMLESVAVERTSVTSGRKCSALLTKSGPLGSLVKMLLVSPLWSKAGYSPTWDTKPLYSERWTEFIDSDCEAPSPSNASAVTSKTSDIPSSRCLFLLRLSERPIDETESSSLPMLQTPTAVMTCEAPERMRERAEKNGYKNGTKYGSLESQVNYDPRFKGLLKTPSAMDAASENMESKGISGTSGTLAQEMMSGYVEKRGFMLPTPRAMEVVEDPQRFIERNADRHNSMPNLQSMAAFGMLPTPTERIYKGYGTALRKDTGKPRLDALDSLAALNMLPTPTARDEKNPSSPNGARIARKRELGYTIELNDLAAMGNLPTPSAREWKGRTNPGIVKEGSGCVYGETLPDTIGRLMKDSSPKTDGGTFRLSPLFTEEMMGFPLGWTTFPFLNLCDQNHTEIAMKQGLISESGEPKPSKPTETP